MLSSSSSSSASSSPSSSSFSCHHTFKSLTSPPSSSSSYHPPSVGHHFQQNPSVCPAPLPLPHYHRLQHIYPHPIIHSACHLHHLDRYPSSIDSTHQFQPLPICSEDCSNERLGNRTLKRIDPYFQAPISICVNNTVIHTSDNNSGHIQSADPQYNTTDCSPRSVIRHVQSSSSAPSPDYPCRPSSCHTHPRAYVAASPRAAFPCQATKLSIARPPPQRFRETNRGAVLLEHDQSATMDHQHLLRPWTAPTTAIYHHLYRDACSDSTLPPRHSGQMKCEAGAEEDYMTRGEMRKARQSFERRGSRSADLHKQREIRKPESDLVSVSATEDKCCMTESDGRVGDGSFQTPRDMVMASQARRYNFGANINNCTVAKPVYNSTPNSTQIEYSHELCGGKSFSCDLQTSKHGGTSETELAPLDYYGDGFANHNRSPKDDRNAHSQLGSKWEDAEKWITPANSYRYAQGCSGFTNLGLLKMSNCINAGNAVNSHCIHHSRTHAPPPIRDPRQHHTPTYSSDCAYYRSQSSFTSSNSGRSSALQERSNKPPSLANHALPNELAVDQLTKEDVAEKRPGDDQNYQCLQGHYAEKLRAEAYASSGATGIKMSSKAEWDDYKVAYHSSGSDKKYTKASITIKTGWDSAPLPQYHHSPNHITDRLASGEALMPCTIPKISDPRQSGDSPSVRAAVQGSMVMPRVLLREVGTQISSVDGSGSISRLTSKSASPQKPISPARHNAPPAHMRSSNGSADGMDTMADSHKQAIDLAELAECHHAKLELHMLPEGERIRSFHRTTSNWSSLEMEEADLSRSLRHSTELDDDNDTNRHPWPSQSYSWNKADDSKLAKLQLKEARIKAWEDKQKTKADAQLKRGLRKA